MKIKRDPRADKKAMVKDILTRHEWLYLRNPGLPITDVWIDQEMLADLVVDIIDGKIPWSNPRNESRVVN